MERVYKEAFTEVEEVFKLMPIDLLIKIPTQFRQVILENKAEDYIANIKEPLNENNFKRETVVILGLIYRDFLASPEERKQLQIKDAEELKRIEEKIQEQYDIENIFKKRKNNKEQNMENNNDSNSMIVYKEQNFLKRFFLLIKGIFGKNKF